MNKRLLAVALIGILIALANIDLAKAETITTFINGTTEINLTLQKDVQQVIFFNITKFSDISNATFNISYLNHSETVCYQEHANKSNGCGTNNTGNYTWSAGWTNPQNIIDGDWGTSAASTIANLHNLTINYTIPIGARNSSKWQIKDNGATTNLTINQSCWGRNVLELRIQATEIGTDYTQWQCYNGTQWVVIRNYVNALEGAFEEGMWWNVTGLSNPYIEIGIVDGTREWEKTGVFGLEGTNTTKNLNEEIESYLSTCTTLNNNFTCNVPITIGADKGEITIKELRIESEAQGLFINFSQSVSGTITPILRESRNFTANTINITTIEYEDGRINIEFIPSDTNTSQRQYYEIDYEQGNVNSETITILNKVNSFIYFRVIDTANRPLSDATIVMYAGYPNSTGYTWAKMGQRITDDFGYTFFNTDDDQKIKIVVNREGYELYEKTFDASDETPRAQSDAMTLTLKSNSSYLASWGQSVWIQNYFYNRSKFIPITIYNPNTDYIEYNTQFRITAGLDPVEIPERNYDIFNTTLAPGTDFATTGTNNITINLYNNLGQITYQKNVTWTGSNIVQIMNEPVERDLPYAAILMITLVLSSGLLGAILKRKGPTIFYIGTFIIAVFSTYFVWMAFIVGLHLVLKKIGELVKD